MLPAFLSTPLVVQGALLSIAPAATRCLLSFARSGSELVPARSVTYLYQVSVDCKDMYIGSLNALYKYISSKNLLNSPKDSNTYVQSITCCERSCSSCTIIDMLQESTTTTGITVSGIVASCSWNHTSKWCHTPTVTCDVGCLSPGFSCQTQTCARSIMIWWMPCLFLVREPFRSTSSSLPRQSLLGWQARGPSGGW